MLNISATRILKEKTAGFGRRRQDYFDTAPSSISYTAEIDPGIGGTKVFSSVAGWTPDSPFNFPTAAGDPLQTRNANDASPITMIAGYNNAAKSSVVILLKNGVIQQSKAVTGVSPPQTFDPLAITNGDTVTLRGN